MLAPLVRHAHLWHNLSGSGRQSVQSVWRSLGHGLKRSLPRNGIYHQSWRSYAAENVLPYLVGEVSLVLFDYPSLRRFDKLHNLVHNVALGHLGLYGFQGLRGVEFAQVDALSLL